jgi:hypothetical protein
MDKEFGKQRNQSWHGVKIIYDREKFDNNAEEDIDDDIAEYDL